MGSGVEAERSELKWFPGGNVRESVEKLKWELRDRAENAENNSIGTEQRLYLCIFFPVWYEDTNAASVSQWLSQNQLFKLWAWLETRSQEIKNCLQTFAFKYKNRELPLLSKPFCPKLNYSLVFHHFSHFFFFFLMADWTLLPFRQSMYHRCAYHVSWSLSTKMCLSQTSSQVRKKPIWKEFFLSYYTPLLRGRFFSPCAA